MVQLYMGNIVQPNMSHSSEQFPLIIVILISIDDCPDSDLHFTRWCSTSKCIKCQRERPGQVGATTEVVESSKNGMSCRISTTDGVDGCWPLQWPSVVEITVPWHKASTPGTFQTWTWTVINSVKNYLQSVICYRLPPLLPCWLNCPNRWNVVAW